MALTGKPAIAAPNQLDLRALQTAISNTRQRIEQLEAAVNTLSLSGASATTIAQMQGQIAALQQALGVLTLQLVALTDTAADGATMVLAQRIFGDARAEPGPAPTGTAGSTIDETLIWMQT